MLEIVRLAATPGVESTVCDMCAYGMQITDKNGNALVEKSTQFLTNAPEVCTRISQRCSNSKEFGGSLIAPLKRVQPKLHHHSHADVMGGGVK